ncbi:MAG TPA: HIT family protein [Acidimicrobiia bacterium]|nr:HIT family protein [Acidimicrobiia bacterium]
MPGDCEFCAIAAGDPTADAHVVYSDADVVAFFDHRPVFKGHTLVIPRQHVVTLPELSDELLVPVFSVARRVAKAMEAGFGADGTFVANNNRISQSVAHLHVHVIPRHKKDGLRGFFWPRQKYESPKEAAEIAARVRAAIEAV